MTLTQVLFLRDVIVFACKLVLVLAIINQWSIKYNTEY